jgi:hypothetical protein|tara:strand:+ start:324 stop:746 length:423 start_codon:yes stop_codon:yes gene_type:complete
MIQFDLNNTLHSASLDIADAINSTYRPLVQFKSQLTGKSKYFIPTIFTTTFSDRYCIIYWFDSTSEDLDSGIIDVGNTDFPLGFYDVTIYKNISATNLNPAVATPVYYTILNMFDSTKSSSTFTQYTTNDTDTNSVYITF